MNVGIIKKNENVEYFGPITITQSGQLIKCSYNLTNQSDNTKHLIGSFETDDRKIARIINQLEQIVNIL